MKTILGIWAALSCAHFALAEGSQPIDLPQLKCSIQQVTLFNGKFKRETFATADFDNLPNRQRMTAVVPSFSAEDPAPMLDVYVDVMAAPPPQPEGVTAETKVRIYVQVAPHEGNSVIGAGSGYFDTASKTMEMELDSMQATNYGVVVSCIRK